MYTRAPQRIKSMLELELFQASRASNSALWIEGIAQTELRFNRLQVGTGLPLYARSTQPNEIWVTLARTLNPTP